MRRGTPATVALPRRRRVIPASDFRGLISALSTAKVDFIIIGGVAATIHGSARATFDLDVVYDRSAQNIKRLVAVLAPLSPYLRGAPAGLPFRFDGETVQRGLNFTLQTSLGSLDLLGEVVGGGGYQALAPFTIEIVLFGHTCRSVTLDGLIRLKRAAGDPRITKCWLSSRPCATVPHKESSRMTHHG